MVGKVSRCVEGSRFRFRYPTDKWARGTKRTKRRGKDISFAEDEHNAASVREGKRSTSSKIMWYITND